MRKGKILALRMQGKIVSYEHKYRKMQLLGDPMLNAVSRFAAYQKKENPLVMRHSGMQFYSDLYAPHFIALAGRSSVIVSETFFDLPKFARHFLIHQIIAHRELGNIDGIEPEALLAMRMEQVEMGDVLIWEAQADIKVAEKFGYSFCMNALEAIYCCAQLTMYELRRRHLLDKVSAYEVSVIAREFELRKDILAEVQRGDINLEAIFAPPELAATI